ncbi:MerR family transcriptional regulator [Nonomuraea angiospora]|uniref:MerR family transcriptional regulator n=1 Tax=Nonomuraea angiospora TaxID=46172 RepID=UPI00344CAF84
MSHDVSGQPARPAELTYDPGYHALLERLRSHGRQSTASSVLDVKPDELLTIGELARATGVATSALRYWEELGLLPAPTRVSGQRRYPVSAMAIVGLILSLQDIGFSLRELKGLITSRYEDADAWRELHQRKLAELDERIARAQAARTAIAHGLACRHPEGIFHCPTFARVIAARLAGSPLHEAHTH